MKANKRVHFTEEMQRTKQIRLMEDGSAAVVGGNGEQQEREVQQATQHFIIEEEEVAEEVVADAVREIEDDENDQADVEEMQIEVAEDCFLGQLELNWTPHFLPTVIYI